MKVLKFGGTSVAAPERIIEIVRDALASDRVVLVCSAISGCTDSLIRMGHLASRRDQSFLSEFNGLREQHVAMAERLLEGACLQTTLEATQKWFDALRDILQGIFLLGELSPASLDAVQGFGEILSTKILAAKFDSLAVPCTWLDSRELIKTGREGVDSGLSYQNIAAAVAAQPETALFIVPGFIASDEQGRVTTLGRGGSDYTAALFAAAIKAQSVEIWTDVPGIMTSNPKLVPGARTIRHLSYRAAQELSHFGAKVLFPPTVQPVIDEKIPIYVKDTFAPEDPGTLVEMDPPREGEALLGIANSDKIALISLEGSGMVGIPGFSSRLFEALARSGINIILITQASSLHTMCIAISEKDAPAAKRVADETFAYEISLGRLLPLKVETGYSIVCLVGDDILGHSGATGRMLAALGTQGVPVRATAQGSSERNISVIVPSDKADEAIRAIHREFFDRTRLKPLNLFIAGYGTIGKALVKMIRENHDEIARLTGKDLRICALANSRHYLADPAGIDPDALEEGSSAPFIEVLCRNASPGSVFVDCTASESAADWYPLLFKAGYHVVTCNKIPFSGGCGSYESLIASAAAAHAALKYETTVGAALPVLAALGRMRLSGDRLLALEAVLSGTLNYLCDRYAGENFGALVETARKAGYTEPDPATDLSGRDVLRKALIMARTAGFPIEESRVRIDPFPQESELERLYADSAAQGKRLRYAVRLSADGEATVGLCAVGPDSPLYGLKGTDNCAVITTEDYPSPLVIRGAGAGPRQTAGGLLQDILSI